MITRDQRGFSLQDGEQPVDKYWVGVVDARRSGLRKVARGFGLALLRGPLQRLLLAQEESFFYTVTTSRVLVISGLTPQPLRYPAGSFSLTDTGVRRRMRTVMSGRLAGVTLTPTGETPMHLFLNAESLTHVEPLATR